jgi:hypothetical protein
MLGDADLGQAPESDVILGAQATEKRVRETDLSLSRRGLRHPRAAAGGSEMQGGTGARADAPRHATADEDGLLDAGEVAPLTTGRAVMVWHHA